MWGDKFSVSKAVGFSFYMILEHELGKTEHGSVIGLVRQILKLVGVWQ